MNGVPFDALSTELDGTQLIEASAGTGKTWTLCGLYLRLLLERDLPVQRILVVTFTNAAVAELRERIRARLVAALARLRDAATEVDPFFDELRQRLRDLHGLDDAALCARLEQALQCFDEAAILTIHGFCQRALADAPFSAAMPLALDLLGDDGELRLQVVNDFWRRHVGADTLSAPLAEHLLARGDTPARLSELLKRRLAKPLSRLHWPAGIDDDAPLDLRQLTQVLDPARRIWQAQRAEIIAIVEAAQPRLHQGSYTPQRIRGAAEQWDALFAAATPLPPLKKLDKLQLFGAASLKAKRGEAEVEPHVFFAQAQALLEQRRAFDRQLEAQRARLLRTLFDEGASALREAKRTQRVVAFDDMLYNLHQRLHAADGAALAQALRQRFSAALIDEFQDTDPLQYGSFKAIYGGSDLPLFLVGDPKQAIYSFRNADLHTYLGARADAAAHWTLQDNQRAVRPLLQGLNALFAINPQAFVFDGLHFQPARFGAKRRAVLHVAGPPPAPLRLWQLPQDADGMPLPKAQARTAAMSACAAEIARLIAAGARGELKLDERPLRPADIAVLVRSHADGARMRLALAGRGVGSVELSQASVFDSVDAEELQRVMAAMLDSAREPLLRAALATELMGRDAQAIEALAADEAGWQALLLRFADYRDAWRDRGIGVALRQWMQHEGVAARLLARADGERRLTNLLHLSECLHDAAGRHAAPAALWRWLQAQRGEARADEATQLRLESDRNLVPIVTVHRAKGLEYAFVFCPVLWDGHRAPTRGGDGRDYHGADGTPVLDMRSRDGGEIDKAEAAAIDARIRLDSAAETLRLIYVALTRAEQHCTLVVGNYSTKIKDGVSVRQGTRAWLNWLVAGSDLTPQQWFDHKLEPQDIDDAWQTFAAAQAPQVSLTTLPAVAADAQPLLPPPTPQLAARDAPAHIGSGWRIGSYSSLAHGTRQDGAVSDHDLRVPEEADASADAVETRSTPVGDDDILNFPRGSVAGECLHALFERIDFGAADGWPAAIDAALLAQPVPIDTPRARAMLTNLLRDVLHTPLWRDGAALASVPRTRRLVELEFTLPSPALDADALARVLREQGYAVPSLHFTELHGYLRGFIDLVIEHGGRFYVIDWKSNHLGHLPRHYGQSALAEAMDQQAYHLQYLLYALALHRYLRRRLPGYTFNDHFGGVRYLFVRGVRPHWRDAQGRPTGVFAHRPTWQTMQRLDALLAGEAT